MKKFLALLFVAGMFAFTACSEGEGDAADGDGDATEETTDGEATEGEGGDDAAH